MRKAQAIRFWKELQETTLIDAVINKYKSSPGFESKRTLQRYAQADRGFRRGLSLEELSKSTGWSESHLGTLQVWWTEWQTEQSQRAKGIQASGRSSENQAHKNQLRELAQQLLEQFRLNLLQVVRTEQVSVAPARLYAAAPWRVEGLLESIPDPDTDLEGNLGLEIDRKASPPEVFLVVEKNHAFPRLIDHLTWDIPKVELDREMWRKNLSHAVSSAMTLWEELRQRPDLANERWLEPEDWATASHGLLSYFTQIAVAAVCGACCPEIDGGHIRDGHLTILEEARGSTGDRVYQLKWEIQEPIKPINRGIALAVSREREWLEQLRDYHQSLRQELVGHQEVVHLVRALREALRYERDLRWHLDLVIQAENFSGICQECRPVFYSTG